MTTGLRRYHESECVHFITFSCHQRLPLLSAPSAREVFEQELERVRIWYGVYIFGYVVMPEHVHLLVTEPERGKLSTVIQILKQTVSHKLKPASVPHFWLHRYYDTPIWTERKRVEKLRYIHRNPIKRGLVSRPEDWAWSSYRQWATGFHGTVEVECEWTGLERERSGIVSRVKTAS